MQYRIICARTPLTAVPREVSRTHTRGKVEVVQTRGAVQAWVAGTFIAVCYRVEGQDTHAMYDVIFPCQYHRQL